MSINTLHFMDAHQQAVVWENMFNHLEPGGEVFVLVMAAEGGGKAFAEVQRKKLPESRFPAKNIALSERYFLTQAQLRNLVEDAGFDGVVVKPVTATWGISMNSLRGRCESVLRRYPSMGAVAREPWVNALRFSYIDSVKSKFCKSEMRYLWQSEYFVITATKPQDQAGGSREKPAQLSEER